MFTKSRKPLLFIVLLLCSAFLFASISQAQGIKISGYVYDPNANAGIKGIKAVVSEIDSRGKVLGPLGATVESDKTGRYSIECNKVTPKIRIGFWDPSYNSLNRNQYENVVIKSLSGQIPLNAPDDTLRLNVVVEYFKASRQTASEASESMTETSSLLEMIPTQERIVAMPFISEWLTRARAGELPFDHRLVQLVKQVQPPPRPGLITDLPNNIGLATAGFSWNKFEGGDENLVVSEDGYRAIAESFDGLAWVDPKRSSWLEIASGDGVKQFKFQGNSCLTTLSSTSESKNVLVGREDGTVILKSVDGEQMRLTKISDVPIVDTAMSSQGDRWAAVAADGKYAVYDTESNEAIRIGTTGSRYPNSIALSYNGEKLAIGTGLLDDGAALIVVDVGQPDSKPVVQRTTDAVVKVDFVDDSLIAFDRESSVIHHDIDFKADSPGGKVKYAGWQDQVMSIYINKKTGKSIISTSKGEELIPNRKLFDSDRWRYERKGIEGHPMFEP